MWREAVSDPAAAGLGADDGCTWVHASCVVLDDQGVLLMGGSGSGKSDLALRLIDGGATLVADDQVAVLRVEDHLIARPATALAGLIEVRGAGIWRVPWRASCRLALVADLDTDPSAPRLPEPESHQLRGLSLPRLRLDPRAPSACAKVRLALVADRVA